MRFSVVINTYNRADSLAVTLDALRRQTYDAFEVVVVTGPCTDHTDEVLADCEGGLKVARCPVVRLSESRNLGIEHAAGEIVAFIDDDAIPEPRWLEQLAAGYDDDIAGVGGLVLDQTGFRYQYRFSLCHRSAETVFPAQAPDADASLPGADPFVYLQGTNMSFRRAALEAVDGFDEEIAYGYDECELAAVLIDGGHRLRPLEGAVVHHKFLPSHIRKQKAFTDPFESVKSRAYFALRHDRRNRPVDEIVADANEFVADIVDWSRAHHREGGFSDTELARFVHRAEAGLAAGIEAGRRGGRRDRELAAADPDSFVAFPTLRPQRRARIVFTSADYPPKSPGGVARYTEDLATELAARGHDIHVVTRDDDDPSRVDYERGVWVHRYGVNERAIAAIADSTVYNGLLLAATVRSVVERIHAQEPVDAVCGPLWNAELLLCCGRPGLKVVTTCMTSMRTIAELQPNVADDPTTAGTIALEDAVLRRSDHLVTISAANGRLLAEVEGVAERPTTVAHLGVVDHAKAVERRRGGDDGWLEILFVGRLEGRKGVDTLIDAAVRVMRMRPQVHLRLIGADNNAWSAGEDWAKRVRDVSGSARDVPPRVRFDGEVDDATLLQALADADVFCAPSRYESFGLVVLEAMTLGRPVVSTRVGGIPEIAGDTALLVPPGDVDALAEALARIVDDSELRERLGRDGRAHFEAEFTNEVAADRVLAVLLDGSTRHEQEQPPLLSELLGLDPAAAVSAEAALCDPRRYPRDLFADLADHAAAAPADLAQRVQEVVLGRAPSLEQVEALMAAVEHGASLRECATAAIAMAGLETDLPPEAAEVLPDRHPGEVLAEIRRAWAQHDASTLPGALVRIMLGRPDDTLRVDFVRTQAQRGARAALLELAQVGRVQPSAGRIPGLEDAELLTREEIAQRLERIAGLPTEDAVTEIFGLVVGQEPDGRARRRALETVTKGGRGALVEELARSPMAATYGADADIVVACARAVPALWRAPVAAPLRSRRPMRRLELDARDLLRDVRDAGRSARRHEQTFAQLSELSGRLDRLTAQVAPLIEAGDDRNGRPPDAADADVDTVIARLDAIELENGRQLGIVHNWLSVLSTKYEMVAQTLRERIPPVVDDTLPEPRVLDPQALEHGARVNLGCGETPLDGYVNVDYRELPGVDVVADVRRLPFAPGSLAEVASAHLVEHFRQAQLEQVVLPHWRELLVDDGLLRVVTPNLDALVDWYRTGRITPVQYKTVLYGLQDYVGDDHFALYTPELLSDVLVNAGFGGIEVLERDRPNGWSPELELIARPAR